MPDLSLLGISTPPGINRNGPAMQPEAFGRPDSRSNTPAVPEALPDQRHEPYYDRESGPTVAPYTEHLTDTTPKRTYTEHLIDTFKGLEWGPLRDSAESNCGLELTAGDCPHVVLDDHLALAAEQDAGDWRSRLKEALEISPKGPIFFVVSDLEAAIKALDEAETRQGDLLERLKTLEAHVNSHCRKLTADLIVVGSALTAARRERDALANKLARRSRVKDRVGNDIRHDDIVFHTAGNPETFYVLHALAAKNLGILPNCIRCPRSDGKLWTPFADWPRAYEMLQTLGVRFVYGFKESDNFTFYGTQLRDYVRKANDAFSLPADRAFYRCPGCSAGFYVDVKDIKVADGQITEPCFCNQQGCPLDRPMKVGDPHVT